MNALSPITAKRPTTELLADLVRIYGELSARGSLADAPTDWLNALDDGDAAARELLEWFGAPVSTYDANDCGASAPYRVGE